MNENCPAKKARTIVLKNRAASGNDQHIVQMPMGIAIHPLVQAAHRARTLPIPIAPTLTVDIAVDEEPVKGHKDYLRMTADGFRGKNVPNKNISSLRTIASVQRSLPLFGSLARSA
jgi:hypothetical protein